MTADASYGSLHEYLQQLHLTAGVPSCRTIAAAVGLSHTSVNEALTGKIRLPRWGNVCKLVTYLDGEPQAAKALWDMEADARSAGYRRRRGDQQLPKPGRGRPIHELVIEDLQARMALGIKRYGQPLRTHDGRSGLIDLYEELLDAASYIRKLIEEEREKERGEGSEVESDPGTVTS